MNHPTMPAMPPIPPEQPEQPKDRRNRLAATVVALATCGAFFATGFFTGVAVEHGDKDVKESSQTTVDPVEQPDYLPDAEPEPESTYATPSASDFTIELKVKSKQCFGSAGCNVSVEPVMTYVGMTSELDPAATYEVTYEVTGDDSGEIIQTLTLTDQDSVEYTETMVSTSSSSVKPKATVTGVEER